MPRLPLLLLLLALLLWLMLLLWLATWLRTLPLCRLRRCMQQVCWGASADTQVSKTSWDLTTLPSAGRCLTYSWVSLADTT